MVDGAVYGAFVGLGFQVVEDFIYAVNAVGIAGQGDRVGPVIVTFFLRGFLAGLWSHTLFSALAGAGIAYFVVRRQNRSLSRRLAVALACVAGRMGVPLRLELAVARRRFRVRRARRTRSRCWSRASRRCSWSALLVRAAAARRPTSTSVNSSRSTIPRSPRRRELAALRTGSAADGGPAVRVRPLRPARGDAPYGASRGPRRGWRWSCPAAASELERYRADEVLRPGASGSIAYRPPGRRPAPARRIGAPLDRPAARAGRDRDRRRPGASRSRSTRSAGS